MVSKALTNPKAAVAGVMLEISLARLRASIAKFSIERALSRPFCRWNVEAIIVFRGRAKAKVWQKSCEEEPNQNTKGQLSCDGISHKALLQVNNRWGGCAPGR